MQKRKLILKGELNKDDGLYDVTITNKTEGKSDVKNEMQKINIIIQIDKNKADLAKFLHGTLFSPAISTLKKP